MGPIWMNSRTYGYFLTLIPMHLKFLENSPYLRFFVHLQDWWQFCRFHRTGFALGTENFCIGVNFYAESHDQKRFSKFENFTLSWSKVWNLPIAFSHLSVKNEVLLRDLARSLGEGLFCSYHESLMIRWFIIAI